MWEGKEPQEKGCVASAAKEEKKKAVWVHRDYTGEKKSTGNWPSP